MKIFIALENNAGLDSNLDNRFGRASYFMVYDQDGDTVISIEENKYKNEGHGVGTRVATWLVESGCQAVIGAQPGPKAAALLNQAGVKIIVDDKGTVKEALERNESALTV